MSLTKSHEEPLGLSLTDSLARIFDNSIDTDVTFLIGQEEAEVKAHKVFLRSRSPVFRAMFDDSPIAESNTVNIPDTDKASFEAFLRYLYTDELKKLQSIDEVNRMLYLVEKYMMPTMTHICVSFLQNLLDLDTAFQIFGICTLYSLQEFREIVVKYMADRADECCDLESFTQQDHLLIEKFTESPHLCIAETKLLDAVLRWATNECKRRDIALNRENIREVLGKILHNIRFMSIPEAGLKERILIDGTSVLTEGETRVLTRLYNSNTTEMKTTKKFNVTPRTGLSYQVFNIYPQSPSRSKAEKQYALKLTTSDDVWLFGLSLFGPHHNEHDFFCVDIEVKANGTDHFKSTRCLNKEDFSEEVANITFFKHIRLKAKVQYTFLLKIFGSGSDQYFLTGDDLATSVDFYGTTLSFSNKVDPKYESYKGRGQFPRFFLQGMNEAYASSRYKAKIKKTTRR